MVKAPAQGLGLFLLYLIMSYIPQLQKHLISLKGKKENLKVLAYSLNGFNTSEEAESVSVMLAITDMQIDAGKKALIF